MQNYSMRGNWELIPCSNPGDMPSARCGHSLTSHSTFNASTDFHSNNASTDFHSNTNTDHATKESSKNSCNFGKLLLAFGEDSLSSDRKYHNDMHLYDIQSSKWVQICGTGVKDIYQPFIQRRFKVTARADSTACAFSGLKTRTVLKHYQKKLIWNDVKMPSLPTVQNDRCIIFGGKIEDTYLDELVLIKNIHTFPMDLPDDGDTVSRICYDRPLIIEQVNLAHGPCGRRGSCIAHWRETCFVLFGGQRGSLFLNDLWGLDLGRGMWVDIRVRSRKPIPRAFHSMFFDCQNRCIIIGGVCDTKAKAVDPVVWAIDLREGKFNKLGNGEKIPGIGRALAKGHHSSHFISDPGNLMIYSPQNPNCFILGGDSLSEICGQCLEIETETESNISMPRGTCRPATAFIPAAKLPTNLKSIGCKNEVLDRLFVIGGYNPASKQCGMHLQSLRFGSTPCPISNQECTQNTSEPLMDRYLNHSRIRNYHQRSQKSKQMMRNNKCNSNRNNSSNNRNVPLQERKMEMEIEDIPPLISVNNDLQSKQMHVHLYPIAVRIQPPEMIESQNKSTFSQRKIFQIDDELRSPLTSLALPALTITHNNSNNKVHCTNHLPFINKYLIECPKELFELHGGYSFNSTEVLKLNDQVRNQFMNESILLRIKAPIKLFGDIHGQFADLISLFKAFKYPLDNEMGDINAYKYLFMGDFVDRGHKSLEVITLLFALKIQFPERVFLIRGNHECRSMNELYGFHREIYDRIPMDIRSIKYLDTGERNPSVQSDDEDCIYIRSLKTKVEQNADFDEVLDLGIGSGGYVAEYDYEFDDIYFESDEQILEYQRASESLNKVKEFLIADDGKDECNMNRNGHRSLPKRKIFENSEECRSYIRESFERTFQWLPLGALVNERILCLHGGIGHLDSIAQIENISRPCDVVCDAEQEMDENESAVVDILWSDPAEGDEIHGFHENKRGVSCVFGSDIVRNFCTRNDIDLIVRAHQVVADGYEYFAGGHLITLFSATNYCDLMENAGAILCIDEDLTVWPKLVEAVPIKDGKRVENWRVIAGCPPSPMRGTGEQNSMENSTDLNMGGYGSG